MESTPPHFGFNQNCIDLVAITLWKISNKPLCLDIKETRESFSFFFFFIISFLRSFSLKITKKNVLFLGTYVLLKTTKKNKKKYCQYSIDLLGVRNLVRNCRYFIWDRVHHFDTLIYLNKQTPNWTHGFEETISVASFVILIQRATTI